MRPGWPDGSPSRRRAADVFRPVYDRARGNDGLSRSKSPAARMHEEHCGAAWKSATGPMSWQGRERRRRPGHPACRRININITLLRS
jgi:hypothetical protein